MENEDYDVQSNMSQKSEHRTPEEVRERVKEAVAKGVAAVAGALKGFTEEAEKHHLADTTRSAIQKAGEATRQVAGTATEEFKKTKEHVKQSARESGLAKGGAPATGAGYGGRPEDATRTASYESRLGGGIGSRPEVPRNDLSRTSPSVPDLRKVDLGKTDEELE